jgi:hypothetical protein
MESFACHCIGATVSSAIVFEQWKDCGSWVTPGVKKVGNDMYISLYGEFEGHPELVRVSDIEYEKLTKGKKKK